jgi:phage pi2 protein 07
MIHSTKKVLAHPDLQIEMSIDNNGKELYTGHSEKYEPHTASAGTVLDCFFKFNIQLSEQKVISGFIGRS